ncbi:iron chelate uptake ABC transporter family permease subunit [uncultured Sulfitobacter sp.]|uniref:ABC transporter permease n=1 Tax=uncultured Sulfitobacter sp. TaxID=191468 RepID=UPI0030FBDF5D
MAIALGLALVLLSITSLFVGVIDISFAALWSDPGALELIAISRAPRTIAVVISGGALAVSGAIMQMLVRNRFVEPMTAGTGQGAALGILLVTLFAPGASILVQMTLASLTALIAGAGFLAIVHRLPPTQPLLVALVGLIYGGIIGACVTFVAYQADLLQYVDIWMNGEFSGVLQGRYELLWLVALVAALTYFAADQFAIIGMGRTASINLGLNHGQTMLLGLLAVSIVTALTVVTVGMIPFVGLVVPNIVAQLSGDNLRRTLPLTAMTGAVLVLASDILGRILRYPYEIPVGTIFGVIGACLFLWLLYAPKRHVS